MEEQYDKIYRYCYFKLRQRELAEDITQETFLRCFSQGGCQGNVYELRYLYTVARNLCIDEYRKKKALLLQGEEVIEDIGAEERMLSGVALKIALSELEEEERELLLLRYVNEVPVGVICKIWKISRYALYRKVQKALRKLETALED
ncbi:MAG: RNA polymerase sigma factor [Lachnospiraceae bacterium]|nr:RNA polymerase sigma factor [Lachnospiraceae bacterium]